jgi:hypothetical protein
VPFPDCVVGRSGPAVLERAPLRGNAPMVSAECQARRPDSPQSKRIPLSMTPFQWAARFSHGALLPVEARLGS